VKAHVDGSNYPTKDVFSMSSDEKQNRTYENACRFNPISHGISRIMLEPKQLKLQCVFVNFLKVQGEKSELHSGEVCNKSRRLKDLERVVISVVLI
jgi:hypothetical protein